MLTGATGPAEHAIRATGWLPVARRNLSINFLNVGAEPGCVF